jgi:serine protease Do
MMSIARETKVIGISIGIGIFVAAGLFVTIAANGPQRPLPPPPGPIPSSVTAPAEQLGRAFAAVAAYVKPAVVSVYSQKMVQMPSQEFQFPFGDEFLRKFFGDHSPFHNAPGQQKEFNVPEQGMGTGMILDTQGHILTNYHVVSDVDEIRVQLPDKRSFEAKIVGADKKTDVAILELKGSVPANLPTVHLGDSDAVEVGNLAMAIGAPFGLTQTVTTGIISAKGRSDVGIADYEDFLQTDAPINPGNSGGPLINMRGEVIGMNSAIETQVGQFAGVGFAIPVNMIKAMLPTLTKGGQITRGMLGIGIQDITKELAEQFRLPVEHGALVAQVNKGSPAEKAGLKPGDVIVRYESMEVTDSTQLRNLVAGTAPGKEVRIVAIRNGKEETFTATIEKMPAETVAAAKPPRGTENQLTALGLKVQTLDADLARQFGLGEHKGVFITAVEDGSFADAAGLQPGDLIVEADRKPVTTVEEFQAILNRDKNRVLLLVKRENGSVFIVLKLK